MATVWGDLAMTTRRSLHGLTAFLRAATLALLVAMVVPVQAIAQDWATRGNEAWQEILREKRISRDAFYNREVRVVLQRILREAGQDERHWQFAIFEDDEPNAFA